MGIKQLAKLVSDNCSRALREQPYTAFFGRRIAIDASMSIYQFLVAVRTAEASNLTNEAGDITSHLQGLFYRTIKMLEAGIKPVYVFDGKPPELKSSELQKRREKRAQDQDAATKAKEEGDAETYSKFARRVNTVTPELLETCKRLLRLMGVPVIDAAGEAEAQCAAMARAGLVYATASEDMDALTFGTPVLVRNLFNTLSSMAEKKRQHPYEFFLDATLEELELSMAQFIDLCILCGCDYTSTVPKIGPKSALNLVRKHGDIEGVLAALDRDKYAVPDDFDYEGARGLFKQPEVLPVEGAGDEAEALRAMLRWREPDEDGLVQMLVHENNFNEETVRRHMARLKKANKSGAGSQRRLDSFFKPKTGAGSASGVTKSKAVNRVKR